MLSFDHGTEIARIVGGKNDGKIIKIYDNKDANTDIPDIKLSNEEIFDLLPEDYFKGKKLNNKITLEELKELKNSIEKDIEPINIELKKIAEEAKKDLNSKLMREFEILDSGYFVPLCRNEKDQRDSIFCAGASGSGKSTWLGSYLKEFNKQFPKRKIFCFSRVDEDKPIDSAKNVKRIMLNDDLIDDPIKLEELRSSCCIFDDIDTINDKSLKKCITDLRQDILEVGRHFGGDKKNVSKGIFCIATSHLLCNSSQTKSLLNESNKVVFFPRSSGASQISYFLKKYVGMNNKEIEEIFKLASRWVMVSKTYPMYVLSEKKIFLVGK